MNPTSAREVHLAEALEAAEERFLATFELAPVGVAHVAPDGRWLRVNPQLCNILGYDCAELLGLRFQDLTHPADLAADLDQALRTLAGEQSSYRVEKRYIRKDGSDVWVDVRVGLVREKRTERPLYFVAVIDDITRQRAAEQALQRQADSLRALMDGLPDVVARFDREGRHLYVNAAVREATGRNPAEFLGRTNRELGMPESLLQGWEAALEAVVEHGDAREVVFDFRTPQGERRYWSRLVPEFAASGEVASVLSIARELSVAAAADPARFMTADRHAGNTGELEPRLEAGDSPTAEQRLRAVLDAMFAFVGVLTPEGVLLEANRAALEAAGLRPEEVIGKPFAEAYWWSWSAEVQAQLRAAIARAAAGESSRYDVVVRLGPDTFTPIDFMLAPLRDAAGRVTLLVPSAIVIAERVQAEQELRESEARLRRALAAGQMGTWEIDVASGRVRCTDSTDLLFGLVPGDPARTAAAYVARVHPDDRERVQQAFEATIRAGGEHSIEYRVVLDDGSVRWLASRGELQFDEARIPVRLVGALTDITARVQAEAVLRERERQLEAITSNATLALFIMDERQYCVFMNPAAERVTGFRLDQVRGRPLHDCVHHTRPDGRPYPLEECPIDRAFPTNAREQGEEVFIHPDGHFYEVAFTASPIREGGRTVGTVIEVRDITEERAHQREREARILAVQQASAALARSEERFRALADNIPQLVWMADRSGDVFWYNQRWFDYTGTSLDEVRGWGWQRVHHPDHVERVTERIRAAFARGTPWEDTFPLRSAGGDYRWFLSRAVPIRDAAGEISLWFGTNTDITEARNDAAERERLYLEARAASEAKSKFLAVMSHELRTPLNAIIGNVDLLAEGMWGALNPNQTAQLQRVRSAAWHLVSIIDDILTFSRANAGHEAAVLQRTDIVPLVTETLRLLEAQGAAKRITLRAELPPALTIDTDSRKLRQILLNLLGNAIKFTDDGEVVLQVEPGDNTVSISVRDSGPGIPAEHHTRIFEPFTQINDSHTRIRGGTGLGLAVCRELARVLGGAIELRSEPGNGSTFTLRLPTRAGLSGT